MIQAPILDAIAPSGWPTFAIVSSRVAGMVLAGPVFSMATIPGRVRAAFAVGLTLSVVPTVPHIEPSAVSLELPFVIATELLVGVAIGLAAALFMHAVSLAGEVIGVQMGLHIASAVDPTLETTEGEVGRLGNLMELALYLAMGGHLVAIRGLARSFDGIPPGGQADLLAGMTALIPQVSVVFSTAVSIAAPVALPPGQTRLQVDGSVLVNDVLIDRLRIVNPEEPATLQKEGAGQFFAPGPVKPVDIGLTKLRQATLEDANVDPIRGMVELITMQRAYGANLEALRAQDAATATLVNDTGRV